MSRRRDGRAGGRIRPDQRDTDDTTPTVVGPGLRPDHQAAIFSTEEKAVTDVCRRDYRNRIQRMIDWLGLGPGRIS